MIKLNSIRRGLLTCALIGAGGMVTAKAQEAPIINPGPPGEAGAILSAEDAVKVADTSATAADFRFMKDMIPHHNQAVQMAALVKDRTNNKEIIDIAGRIDVSQADEIKFMQEWLAQHGEEAPDPTAHHAMHMSHDMAGMASPEDMAKLADSQSAAFDQLFLELMIEHHKGAITMVNELLDQPGSAYDPVLFEFVNDIINDQEAEIERMTVMLTSLSADPRANLKPGFDDAGEAILNMAHLAHLPKPAGFFDVNNPSGLPPIVPSKDKAKKDEEPKRGERFPLLSFANTDLAFAGDVMAVGNYHGFNLYRLEDAAEPQLISSVVCPGGQGDVSIVGDLLIMSVEQTRGRIDCGLDGVAEDISDERFRGLRIFNISNLEQPVQVGQVQTCRGSHTHSVVSGPGRNGKIIVFNSGTSVIRDEKELDGCIGDVPGDSRTALFRIDVIEIPVDDPSKSRIIDSPTVFADFETGEIAGLWQGGDHGEDTQETYRTDMCHDITVFPELKLAAGACSGNGIIFDISRPMAPKRIDAVVDEGFAYWHSATFNNDGDKVIFTDEWGGGGRPRCRAYDPKTWGANAIYDVVDGKLKFRSHYKLPAPQTEEENCVAHNGSIAPVPGRDIFVQAWYQGGLSVIDFTDSENIKEIAYFDRGPLHKSHMQLSGFWSTYWYDGKIYGTEIARGLDVFELTPSEFLTENEIAASKLADMGERFNPQQQFQVTWPHEPVVALAYIDQLERHETFAADKIEDLREAVNDTATRLEAGETSRSASNTLRNLAGDLDVDGADRETQKRLSALSDTLNALAQRLR